MEVAREAAIIRHDPVKLTFENVKFEVTTQLSKSEAKIKGVTIVKNKILKDVSGYAMPG